MPNFKERSYEPEIMDDFTIKDDGLLRTLKELDIINHWLGGNKITLKGLEHLLERSAGFLDQIGNQKQSLKIVDLGCGSGEMLRLVAQWAEKHGIQVDLVGIDANPTVIEYAQQQSKGYPQISYQVVDIFSKEFEEQNFDIVLCTLFLHHFDEETLTGFFQRMKEQAKLGIVINDLHRNWFAYYSISLLTASFSKSYMTKYDAKLSVRRGFLKPELENPIKSGEWEISQFKWAWAFRWQVVLTHTAA